MAKPLKICAMSKVTRIALVGASGLIGMSLIRLAVGRPDLRIVAVARRELQLPPGARMEVLLADPANWAVDRRNQCRCAGLCAGHHLAQIGQG